MVCGGMVELILKMIHNVMKSVLNMLKKMTQNCLIDGFEFVSLWLVSLMLIIFEFGIILILSEDYLMIKVRNGR